jgi:hypothetical protein
MEPAVFVTVELPASQAQVTYEEELTSNPFAVVKPLLPKAEIYVVPVTSASVLFE